MSVTLWVGAFCSTMPRVQAQGPAEWSAVETLSRQEEVGSAPTLACDDSGAVHVFWESEPREEEDVPVAKAIAYSRWRDGVWSPPVDVVVSPGYVDALFPRAVVDTIGRLHLFWSAPGQGPFGPVYHSWAPAVDAADARQWQPAQRVADSTYQCDARLDSQGRLHVVYASVMDGYGICHVVSEDYGDSWSERHCIPQDYPLRDEESEVRPRLAIDSRDTLHVVWVLHDYSAESKLPYDARAVYYARSEDGGLKWSSALSVEEVDGRKEDYNRQVDGFPVDWGNIVVDRNDGVHIVWVGRLNMQRYHQWSDDGGRTWSAPQVAIPSGGYNHWQGLAVDDDNRLHLVWPSVKGLEYAWWDGEAWAAPVLVSSVGGPHHAQAAITLGNQLHVVWQDHGGDQRGREAFGHVAYAMLETDAPARMPQAVPRALLPGQMTATPAPSRTPVATATPTARPQSTPMGASPPARGSAPANPIVAGIIPAVLIVGIVLLWQIRKR